MTHGDQYGHLLLSPKTRCLSTETAKKSHLCHPGIANLMTCRDTSWLSAPFINQRQASPLTRRDQCGHLHPSKRCQHLPIETTLVSPWSSRDNQGPIMVIRAFVNQRQASPLIETTLVSPSSSRDGKPDDMWRPIMVICRLCQPKASEPIDTQRPMSSLAHFRRRLNVYRLGLL